MSVPVMDEISYHTERWRAEIFIRAKFWAFESIRYPGRWPLFYIMSTSVFM